MATMSSAARNPAATPAPIPAFAPLLSPPAPVSEDGPEVAPALAPICCCDPVVELADNDVDDGFVGEEMADVVLCGT